MIHLTLTIFQCESAALIIWPVSTPYAVLHRAGGAAEETERVEYLSVRLGNNHISPFN